MIKNQDRLWTLFCRRRRRCWVNIFTTKSLGLFSTLMSDNWAALMSQSHLAVWPYEVFSALVCVHHDRTSGEALCRFMPTSMACVELARCPNCCCVWARLVLSGWNLIVRGTIFRSSDVPNNKQSCWVFHVLGESCTTIIYQIWSGVFFQWLQLAIVLQTST